MVSVHRALVQTTAVLAALAVASTTAATPQPASDVSTPSPGSTAPASNPAASPTPSSVPSNAASTSPTPTTTAPATAATTAKLYAPKDCPIAKLAINGQNIDVTCGGVLKSAATIGTFTVLEVAVESTELVIESLNSVPIENLQIHGGAVGVTNFTGVPPVVNISSSLANVATISSLGFSFINFTTSLPTLKIPDTVSYLKLEGTNAADLSLQFSGNSSLSKVDFIGNPMTTIPKCLYERLYTNRILANLVLADKSTKYLPADAARNISLNINPATSSFDPDCVSSTVSADGASSDKFKVCSSPVASTPLTPAPSYGSSVPSDGATSTSKKSSSSNTTLIAILSVVAVVAVVVGAVLFRKLGARRSAASSRDDNSVNLIGKDDASGNGKLSFISGDDSLRALRLQQHEVTLTKSLGTGRLWLGEFAGTKVLVKRIEAEVSDAYVTKNLMSQSQVLATLKHDNIVPLVGVTWLAGTDFALVAEFMDKSNLKTVLADANWPLDIHAKLRMCSDIAQGLAYLHAADRNLYVRNFSSRKVLVNSSSECKLNVFDIYPSSTKFESIESYGAGEIAWFAPELITHSSPQDVRKINMYAFGVVMCEILARAAPFQSLAEEKGNTLSDVEIVQRVRRHEALAPHENRPEYLRAPQSLRDVVDRCLAHSPLDRPSASDVLAALEAASSEITATQLLI